MKTFIDSALTACAEIREYTQQSSAKLFTALTQGHGGDITHYVDKLSETILYNYLSQFGAIYSEESGWMNSNESGYTIIIDPIDGSDNFLSHVPYYGISLLRQKESKPLEALVMNLANGDFFVRTENEYYRGNITLLDEKHAIMCDNVPKVGLFEKAYENPHIVEKLQKYKLKFRSPGAVALSLAYAPYVKYVLFLGTMRPYDIQAGLYLSKDLKIEVNDNYLLVSYDNICFEQLQSILKEYF